MIQGFADRRTKRLFQEARCPAAWRAFERVALRKLDMIDAAVTLADLRVPPGNRLETLKGDRAGQNSIRINDQWRICFQWTEDGPTDVQIVDYHRG
jgi:proteic killer suppression protein